ncbi:MAG TPA: zinc-dependent metalloprotease [Fimbriimonadaceae bacterium]|nr:zinc-dependent metalloprotease [Fimbriimonadaceae bacterium]
MKRLASPLALLCLLFTVSLAAPSSQNKVTLRVKADAGQTARRKTNLTLTFEAAGQKFNTEVESYDKVTFAKVDANGQVTIESETESMEVKVNGQKIDAGEDAKEKSTAVVSARNELVSYKSDGEPDETKLGIRISQANNIVYPEGAVGPGDRWTHTFKADATLGTEPGTAEYTLVEISKLDGIDVAKVSLTYKETASGGLTNRGTVWVEVKSGDAVKAEWEMSDVPFGPAGDSVKATVKGSGTRVGGGPLKEQAGQGESAPKEKTIDDVVKGFDKLPGVFTFYKKRESGRDTIYLEIREDQLDKLLLLQATAATGTSDRVVQGDPIADIMFAFKQLESDRLFMVVPNIAFRADPNRPIAKSVERSFAESFLEAYKIEARSPERKSLLINVSDLFRGDIAQVTSLFAGGGLPIPGLGGGGPSYSLDREKTFIKQFKVFPENMWVQTTYNFARGGGGRSLMDMLGGGTAADGRSMVIDVNYNLFFLPNGYTPRRADSRVGYFTAEYQDFTNDRAANQTVRNIIRWRLEKSDPAAALSKPKKPIKMWMDNAIPEEYRDAVRDALLGWNKAFEKIGIKDAIEVEQMPENADFDPSDMRYNVIRWVSSPENAYAIALFRVDPRTGEIVNAGINVDTNIVRFFAQEHSQVTDPASFFQDQVKKHERGACCDLSKHVAPSAMFGLLALESVMPAFAKIDELAYVNQFIKWVVAHEFGHILGLRHNFVSSTELSLAQLGDASLVNRLGTSASVMDYIPFNIGALKKPGVPYFGQTIGTYDYWAIDYGYRITGATDPEAELPALKALASQCNRPGHAYQSDETADGFDPYVVRFDLAKEPIDYWTRTMEVSRYLLMNLDKRLPKPGKSFYEFTRDFRTLLGMYAQGAAVSSRYVGGLVLNGNFKGDPGQKDPIVPIDGAKQKRALELLNTYIFAENAFALPKRYFTKFASDPDANMIQSLLSGGETFPVRDQFSGIQTAALRRIMSTQVLSRVANNEFKAVDPSKALTMAYLFRSVGQSVWSELGTGRSISALRRDLQRAHVDALIGVVLNPTGPVPNDAKMLAWDELKRVHRAIAGAKLRAKDAYTPIHLREITMRIERALDAEQTIGGGGAPQRSLLEELLGGGVEKKGGG